jgi:hypothetical protein
MSGIKCVRAGLETKSCTHCGHCDWPDSGLTGSSEQECDSQLRVDVVSEVEELLLSVGLGGGGAGLQALGSLTAARLPHPQHSPPSVGTQSIVSSSQCSC